MSEWPSRSYCPCIAHRRYIADDLLPDFCHAYGATEHLRCNAKSLPTAETSLSKGQNSPADSCSPPIYVYFVLVYSRSDRLFLFGSYCRDASMGGDTGAQDQIDSL